MTERDTNIPAVNDQEQTLTDDEMCTRTLAGDDETVAAVAPRPWPESIGDYRIVGVLGQGGMGVVYEAEQQHPRRQVAVKVMRRGHEVDDYHARLFQREAETLGRLKHPNIAAIYASGHTEDGRDFFAMELAPGMTLDHWLKNRPTPVDSVELELRLRLFRMICDAVHYAHQRSVIHRDLKPSNIMVAEASTTSSITGSVATPMIKILDFGLARITDQETATLTSEMGTIKGTLPYMSPEQAQGRHEAVDVRTDVYALGVILYEMLAGHRPYDTNRGSLVAAIQVICEQTPKPLQQSWSGSCKLDPDVVTIVGKALEKGPDRRYSSVASLGDDIERYLTSQPILARPPTVAYQLRKFAGRNRALVSSAVMVVMMLAVLAVVMSIQAGRIAVERDRANHEATTSRAVSEFLIQLFEEADPGRAKGEDVTARELLDAGATRLESLAGEPLTQAAFLETIGRVYGILGVYDEGQDLLERAVSVRAGLPGDELAAASGLFALATLLDAAGKSEQARDPVERAVEIRERLLGDHPDLATSLNTLGNVTWHLGDLEQAERIHRRALAIREKTLGGDHHDIAQSLHNIGALRFLQGDLDQAEELYQRSIEIEQAARGVDHWNLATSLHTLAIVRSEKGDYAGAQDLEQRSLAIREKVLGPDHPHVALSLTTLGNILLSQGLAEDAVTSVQRAVDIAERSWGPTHPEVWWMRRCLARALGGAGRSEEAEAVLHGLVATIEAAGVEKNLPLNLVELGALYRRQGRLDQAAAVYERALRIARVEAGQEPSHEVAMAVAGLADVHSDAGRTNEAEAAYREAMLMMEAMWGTEDRDYLRTKQSLDKLLGG